MAIINIYETKNPNNKAECNLIIEEPMIDVAYFAEKEVRPIVEISYEIYKVTSTKETLQSIAQKYKSSASIEETVQEMIAINNLKPNNKGRYHLLVESQIGVPIKKLKGEEIYFKPINRVRIGQPFYLVVETENLKGNTMRTYIKQREGEGIVGLNQAIPMMDIEDTGVPQNYMDAKVGAWASKNKLLNKEEYQNWAISEIRLSPHNEKNLVLWKNAIDATVNKVIPLFIVVDAYSQNEYFKDGNNRLEKLYYGGKKNQNLKVPVDNVWLDIHNKSFELVK